MLNELKKLLENSYAPYSSYHVSAILITKTGKKYEGVNIENASYGATICAERVAIFKAISKKETSFKELHILNDKGKIGMPCFMCRQVFLEFFDENTKIYVYNTKGDYETYTVKELCPHPFSKEDLKWKAVS